MSWVQQHIASFGGNGDDITIFGESAGGNSMMHHLVQKPSFGLYSKVIVESGTYEGSKSLEEAEAGYHAVLQATQCADLSCLLQMDSQTLTSKCKSKCRVGGPTRDGVVLTDSPIALMARGEYNTKVPVMLLSCRDESAGKLVYKGNAITTDAELDTWITNSILPFIKNTTDADVATLRRLYDASRYPYPKVRGNYSIQLWMQDAIYTDRMDAGGSTSGRCSMRSVAMDLLAGGSPSVRTSLFGHTARRGKYSHFPLAWHGCEVSYVLGSNAAAKDADEMALTRKTVSYWSNFALKGDPNSAGLPQWPNFNATDEPTMILNVDNDGGIGIRTNQAQNEACEWWEYHKMNTKATNVVPAFRELEKRGE